LLVGLSIVVAAASQAGRPEDSPAQTESTSWLAVLPGCDPEG